MKKLLLALTLLLLLIGGGGYLLLQNPELIDQSGSTTDLYALVPDDASYIIEVDKPIDKWDEFKSGPIWQHLKGSEDLKDINEGVESLEEVLSGKEQVLRFFLKSNMLISAHVTKKPEYDFLYTVNLRNAGAINLLSKNLPSLLKKTPYKITQIDYQGQPIFQSKDEEGNIFNLTFKDKALLASYDLDIVKRAINTFDKAYFPYNDQFATIQDRVDRNGLSNVYINYPKLGGYVNCFTNPIPAPIDAVSEMLSFSGLDVEVGKDYLELDGKSIVNTNTPSYLKAMMKVNKAPSTSHNILPNNTSFYTSLTFDDFNKFTKAIESLQGTSTATGNKLEQMIQEKVMEELPNWIDNEISLALIPKKPNSVEQAYVAIIPTGKNRKQVNKKIESIFGTLDTFNPTRLFGKKDDNKYKGFRIVSLPIEDILKSVGGAMFAEIKRPKMVLVGEYLLFCDDVKILHHIIDKYTTKRTLSKLPNYQRFIKNFKKQSNVYTYIQMKHFYPFLENKATGTTKEKVRKNKAYILSFPYVALQLLPESSGIYQTYLRASFTSK